MKFDLGYIALIFAIPAFLPQVYKLYKTNDSTSFSSRTVLLFWFAQIFWILHGFQKSDNIIRIGATINLLCFTYILYKIIINNEFDPLKE
tara:strand:- start:132 stop:401 length:270 start_codon:yes stop_codon:yes gene_type:complete